MNEVIPFKKSILFKTTISSITDINLSYDYKVYDGVVEGSFDLYGSYKMTEASVNSEEFMYNIPFSIALSDRIDKDSINLELENYDYKINKDVLDLEIYLKLNYEEISVEKTIENEEENTEDIEEIIEPEEEKDDETLIMDDILNLDETKSLIDDITIDKDLLEDNNKVTIMDEENNQTEINNETINVLTESFADTEDEVLYKVHIIKEDETIESICNKYKITEEEIKKYNDISSLNINDKLVFPLTNE